MEEFETDIEYYGNIPEEFRAVQQYLICIDSRAWELLKRKIGRLALKELYCPNSCDE